MQRTAPDARVEMERQRDLHNRIVQEIAQVGTQNRKALQGGITTYATGCAAFTRSLSRVIWPPRFKPDLPAGYDGSNNTVEFLQIGRASCRERV